MIIAVLLSLYGAVLSNSLAVIVSIFFMAGWVVAHVAAIISKTSEAITKIKELEETIKKLETNVASVNSKLNLVIPDNKKPFNRG